MINLSDEQPGNGTCLNYTIYCTILPLVHIAAVAKEKRETYMSKLLKDPIFFLMSVRGREITRTLVEKIHHYYISSIEIGFF